MIFISFCLKAQTKIPDQFNRNFFVEFGGPGLCASMNFQQKIIADKKEGGLFYRVGLGGIGPIINAFLFTSPVGLQYKLFKKFEIGAGATFFYFTDAKIENGYFISLAYYVTPVFRLVLNSFFIERSTGNYYFSLNHPIQLWGGLNGILTRKKN